MPVRESNKETPHKILIPSFEKVEWFKGYVPWACVHQVHFVSGVHQSANFKKYYCNENNMKLLFVVLEEHAWIPLKE